MNEQSNGLTCAAKMWLLALLLGAILAIVLSATGAYTGKWAIVLGLLFFLVGGALMAWLLCKRDTAEAQAVASSAPSQASDDAAAAADATADAMAAQEADEANAAADAAAEMAVAEKAAAKSAAAEKAAAEKAAAEKAAAEAATKAASSADSTDYDGDGTPEGTDEGTRPATLDGPRDGAADDLKMIKGIGPKLEKLCNSMGFYHFDQIAAWTGDEVAWVNANLAGFKGRVSRDNWVEQAATLAAGGSTEFANRVKKGDVYD